MRRIIIIPILLLVITFIFYTLEYDSLGKDFFSKKSNNYSDKKIVVMNVFIHGSFGTALGILSLPSVIDDNVRGSYYRETNKRIRNDSFFYKDQPILDRGLVTVEPSFDRSVVHDNYYAAYPILKSYDLIDQRFSQHHSTDGLPERKYYTFGWTGLLSQSSRRFEAIRLYNALIEERERLKALGYSPFIRLITHSHGGNLALNLASVQAVLSMDSFPLNNQLPAVVSDYKGTIAHTLELLKLLPSYDDASNKEGQKRLDYVPTQKNLEIEELILYGCPIQPETVGFCCSPIFKTIYNFYSGEDVIQRVDWVTSYRHYSDQRIENTFFDQESWSQIRKKIYQIKLMIGREWQEYLEESFKENGHQKNSQQRFQGQDKEMDKKVDEVKNIAQHLVSKNDQPEKVSDETQKNTQVGMSWWDFIFASKQAFSRMSQDPTHKELWYCSWQKESLGNTILNPLPLVVLTPLFIDLIKKIKKNDLDLNIKLSLDALTVYGALHDTAFFVAKKELPRALIEELKAKTLEWRPKETTLTQEFNAVYRHLL